MAVNPLNESYLLYLFAYNHQILLLDRFVIFIDKIVEYNLSFRRTYTLLQFFNSQAFDLFYGLELL